MNTHFKQLLFFFVISFCFITSDLLAQGKLKVACVGNSITENTALPSNDKYPAILQRNIGTDSYEVRNYGISGCTLLKKGNSPYWNQSRYHEVLNWKPDIVIIKMGTNDAKPGNWVYKADFKEDYLEFVHSFQTANPDAQIFVCYPIPSFPGNGLAVDDKTITDEIIPIVDAVAQETGATVIDLHTPLVGRDGFTYDKTHPNVKGTTVMAYVVAKAICPECAVPDLPEDLFLRITATDYTDRKIEFTTSVTDLSSLENLIDNDVQTEINVPFAKNTWFRLKESEPVKLTGYAVTPSKDAGNNAPKSWRVQGSNNGLSWTDIDTQTNVQFYPLETKVIEVPFTGLDTHPAYTYFRLLIVENNGGEKLQLSEWQFFGSPAVFKPGLTQNGGTITGQHAGVNSNEGIENLIDGRLDKKYCTDNQPAGWVQYDSPVKASIQKYALTSGYSLFERDPKTWQLLGSNNGTDWEVLDSRSNQDFMSKYNTVEFTVDNPAEYTQFRLNITENNGGSLLQFTEWQLFENESNTSIVFPAFKSNVFSCNGKIYIETEVPINYQIVTICGQKVGKGKLPEGVNQIAILQRGIYIVQLSNSSGNTAFKLFI